VDGETVGRERQLFAALVTKRVNRIAHARLVYLDGVPATSDFPLSNAATFVPGHKIEVLAGPSDAPVSLFVGVIVRQSLKVRAGAAAQLIVDCRHKSTKLTVGRKNAYFQDQTDADIIAKILQDAGIDGDVADTSVTHAHQTQFRCTDWDFLLARAEANGMLVFTNDDKVAVKPPTLEGEPVCRLHYGSTMIEFDAQIDARTQYAAVKAVTWDPAEQEVVERSAADPGVSGPGNLTGDELADVVGLEGLELCHSRIAEEEAQAWADAQWLKSRMSKVSGLAKCEGIGTVQPGDLVALDGVGERYNGSVFVTGVRHGYGSGDGWKTFVQFGGVDAWATLRPDVAVPVAGGLLPGVHGLQIGKVTSNEDTDGEYRVRVRLPLMSGDDDGVWARVASVDAGDDRGFVFRPEIDDEVVVGFLDGDPRRAVILGMLHSSAKPAPLEGSDDNHEKVYQSRSKMRLYFDDDGKVLQLETPEGNRITMSEKDKVVRVEDQNGNKMEMTEDGIKIESGKAIEIKAGTDITLESGSALAVNAGGALTLDGASGAELTSTSTTSVKGSLIQLN